MFLAAWDQLLYKYTVLCCLVKRQLGCLLLVRPMRTLTLILLVMLAAGCDSDSGGGIAGASWDSKKNLAEVENYQGYIAPTVSEVIVENQCHGRSKETWAGISQHFEDIFRSFPFYIERLEGKAVEIPELGLQVSFQNREFIAKKDGVTLIHEKLPSVFVMHPMRLGVTKLGGNSVVMVVNKSRASTGRYFVAIYNQDGTVLYRNVLVVWQVWDIERTTNSINILGCSETRQIAWKNRPNKRVEAGSLRRRFAPPPLAAHAQR